MDMGSLASQVASPMRPDTNARDDQYLICESPLPGVPGTPSRVPGWTRSVPMSERRSLRYALTMFRSSPLASMNEPRSETQNGK
jgi:hypothetical protein